jgi:hypothetical protein
MIQIGSVPHVHRGMDFIPVVAPSKGEKVQPISGDQSRGFNEHVFGGINVEELQKLDNVSPVHLAFQLALRTADEIEDRDLLKFIV